MIKTMNVYPSPEDLAVLTLVAAKLLADPQFDNATSPESVLSESELFEILLPTSDREAFRQWLEGSPFDTIVVNLMAQGYIEAAGGGYRRTGKCFFTEEELSQVTEQDMYELSLMCLKIDSRSYTHDYI